MFSVQFYYSVNVYSKRRQAICIPGGQKKKTEIWETKQRNSFLLRPFLLTESFFCTVLEYSERKTHFLRR